MRDALTINDSVYGSWELTDPAALAIVSLPQFQRLYHVGQYGSYWIGIPEANTNRAEHSLGVFHALEMLNRPFEERITGLVHDISHTVFSHVIDYVYNDSAEQKTQDRSHSAIIGQPEILAVLKAYDLDSDHIGDLESFPILDRDLPDICADRLDYFLRDSICYGEITSEEARGMLAHVSVVGDTIVLNDPDIARFFVTHSIVMTKKYWGPPWGCFIFERTAEALKKAIALDIITKEDFYLTDHEVWQRLRNSGDKDIAIAVGDVEHIKTIKLCLDPENYEYKLRSKFRVMDPLILTDNHLERTSDHFPELKTLIADEREQYERGYCIRVERP